MHLKGSEGASIKAKGSYGPEGQIWGWTIEFVLSETHLVMNMENVPPNGEAVWAVRATYERAFP